MNKQIKNTIQNETPFKVIEIGKYEIRLYWTARKGVYGHQVVSEIYSNHAHVFFSISSGCGYCKESEMTTKAFREIGIAPRELKETIERHCHDTINYRYKVGGNFYRVPKKDILKIKMRKR